MRQGVRRWEAGARACKPCSGKPSGPSEARAPAKKRTRGGGADGLEAGALGEGNEAALAGRHARRVVDCKAQPGRVGGRWSQPVGANPRRLLAQTSQCCNQLPDSEPPTQHKAQRKTPLLFPLLSPVKLLGSSGLGPFSPPSCPSLPSVAAAAPSPAFLASSVSIASAPPAGTVASLPPGASFPASLAFLAARALARAVVESTAVGSCGRRGQGGGVSGVRSLGRVWGQRGKAAGGAVLCCGARAASPPAPAQQAQHKHRGSCSSVLSSFLPLFLSCPPPWPGPSCRAP